MASDVKGSAVFDVNNDCYRYVLTREWSDTGLTALFVLMNPSCADADVDDGTIKGVTRKVRSWTFAGAPFRRLLICNTFAYRAKDQRRLTEIENPIGPDNDQHIREAAKSADMIVLAYGNPRTKALRARGPAVAEMLRADGHDLYVLGLGATSGVPKHPLYITDETVPEPWIW
ncbi:MAG: DUF1643 domain-containing protein [Alphaproteobacteria bacterium]|nr:DUF1643 domain-containing protein [Alphaproteobacteria bacterium]